MCKYIIIFSAGPSPDRKTESVLKKTETGSVEKAMILCLLDN